MATKHYLSINDISKKELEDLLELSSKLKQDLKAAKDQSHLLKGKSIGMIFEKPSLRTRISFEVGIQQLGAQPIVLSDKEIQIGSRESRYDVARVMSRYLDAIMIRTFGHDIVEEIAESATVPVVNGLTDEEHPCQTIADLLTIKEHFGSFDGLKLSYIGDGNNTVKSLMLACTKLGINIQVATPKNYAPGKNYESEFARTCHSVGDALEGAHVVYTDVWSSMGQEKEAQARKADFSGYQINTSVLNEFASKNAIVLHCLPAHRGEEITAEALKDHEETILNQAENRLHTQKAILLSLLGEPAVV